MIRTVAALLSLGIAVIATASDERNEARAMAERREGLRQLAKDDYTAATKKFTEALQIESGLGHADHQADALELIGCMQWMQAQYDQASGNFARARTIWQQQNQPSRQVRSMHLGAISWLAAADKTGADTARKEGDRLRKQAAELCTPQCLVEGPADVLIAAGVIIGSVGDVDYAIRLLKSAATAAAEVNDHEMTAFARLFWASLSWKHGAFEHAAPLFLSFAEALLLVDDAGKLLERVEHDSRKVEVPLTESGRITFNADLADEMPMPGPPLRTGRKLKDNERELLNAAAAGFERAAIAYRAIQQPLDEAEAWQRARDIYLGLRDGEASGQVRWELMRMYRRLGNAAEAHRFEQTPPGKMIYQTPPSMTDFIDLGWIPYSNDFATKNDQSNRDVCQWLFQLEADAAEIDVCVAEKQLVTGKFDAAVERLTAVRDQAHDSGLARPEAAASLHLGRAYILARNPRQALEELEHAHELLKSHPRTVNYGRVLTALASAHAQLGDYSESFRLASTSIDVLQSLGDTRNAVAAYVTLAAIYARTGDLERATEWFLLAQRTCKDIGEGAGQAEATAGLAQIHLARKDYRAAVQICDEVLRYVPEKKDGTVDYWHVRLHLLKAKALAAAGDLEAARATYPTRAADQISIPELAAESAMVKAAIEHGATHTAAALAAADEALNVSTAAHLANSVAEAQELRGAILESQSSSEALIAYDAALQALAELRDSLDVPDLKLSFGTRTANLYRRAFALLIREGRDAEAFDLVERARARTFLDQLAQAEVPLQSADGFLLNEQIRLRREISALEAQARKDGNQLVADDLRMKRIEYSELLARIRATASPSQASAMKPLTWTDIQKALDPDTTLIAYYLTEDESHVFILTRSGAPVRVQVPASPASLTSTVRVLHDFSSPTSDRHIDRLSQALIAPLLPHLKTKRLVIVPFGVLHYAPFAALKVSSSEALIDRFELFELPAASVLPVLPKTGTLKSIFAIGGVDVEGLSPLSTSAAMLRRVAGNFNAEPVVGKAATEDAFWSGTTRADILFVLAHGTLEANAPLFSRFYLAPSNEHDGVVEIQELENRRITARLVVLGSCETHLGVTTAGDDVVALNRVFLARGASSVLATLWRVPQRASEKLMEMFFQRVRAGDSPVAALQKAQLDVRSTPEFADPHFWAGFTLTGR